VKKPIKKKGQEDPIELYFYFGSLDVSIKKEFYWGGKRRWNLLFFF